MPEELTPSGPRSGCAPSTRWAFPLGPGQPPAFLRALGARTDWTALQVYGALLAVGTELFSRPGVRYLSGFYGPLERALRDSGADVDFMTADFRRFRALLQRQRPRVMATVATPRMPTGGARCRCTPAPTVAELHRAGSDPDRLLVVEAPRGSRAPGGGVSDISHTRCTSTRSTC